MTNLQIGTLVLNTELLVYLLAGFTGVLAVRSGSGNTNDRERDVSSAWSAVLIWLAAWKGSLLLVDTKSVISNPMSLLFFDGGMFGFWLASAAALGWSGYRFVRLHGWKGGIRRVVLLASGWTAFCLLAILVWDASALAYWRVLGWLLACVVWWMARGGKEFWRNWSWKRGSAQAAAMLLIAGLVSALLYDQARTGLLAELRGGDGEPTAAAASEGASAGKKAPVFELESLAGDRAALADSAGSVTLLNFWTTWCKVCKTEMPHVQKLYEFYEGEGRSVKLLSVNVTSQESGVETVRRYMEKYGYSFPLALDESGSVADRYRVNAFPTTFVIDGDGVIRERFLGAISYADMKKRVDRVLAAGSA
ncbi:TlpA family protein disulfide reductase [Paenibacillus soyae]|uniref:TlpA family protein disulfide reductase n=1 Tax=Paenibacillus soyae TaxID=2969249 RepID=A0A9X2MT99_9BACL|nr:TlpA disulfide reductase family protein [Paenibacillus soyae]MCR2807643.1 TlpA family protein disulfide reductase [Paenibacillus soyae]